MKLIALVSLVALFIASHTSIWIVLVWVLALVVLWNLIDE